MCGWLSYMRVDVIIISISAYGECKYGLFPCGNCTVFGIKRTDIVVVAVSFMIYGF